MMNTNNSYNPSFGRFIVPKSSHRRFMAALREECSVSDLVKIRNTFENQIKNKNNINLIDLGYHTGRPCNGHLSAEVNGKTYTNTFTLSFPRFMKKLARKAEKQNPKKQISSAVKVQKAQEKLDLAYAKHARKIGLANKSEQENYLLGEIYKMISR